MEIQITDQEKAVVVAFEGDIDLESSPKAR